MRSNPLAPILVAVGLVLTGCASGSARVERGLASWHGPSMFSGESRTASGRKWWNWKMIAAHRTLPIGTVVRVTNERTGRSARVEIIDRGPYIAGRIIDVSPAAARKLGMKEEGVAPVSVEVIRLP